MVESNYTNNECFAIFLLVLFIIIIIAILSTSCYKYYGYRQTCIQNEKETFSSFNPKPKDYKITDNYNALYTSPVDGILYTQPPGDVAAQEYAGTNQGTSGEFFPLQGRAAGTFMKNSSMENLALPSQNAGIIGGGANYMEQDMASNWIGFNNFGSPFQGKTGPAVNTDDYSDSYLIDGSNKRVLNSGQQGLLPAQNWWPKVKKNDKGYALQTSDAMVTCNTDPHSIESCKQAGQEYLKFKFEPEYAKVLGN